MTVREMTIEDISAAVRVDCEAFSKAWSEKNFREEIEKDYSHYFLAESGGDIVGYCGIWCIYETAELIRIGVLPSCRRQGIAAELLAAALGRAKISGCERMMLEVRRSNNAARSLYEKYGFREISVRKGYYDGEDAIIMEVTNE